MVIIIENSPDWLDLRTDDFEVMVPIKIDGKEIQLPRRVVMLLQKLEDNKNNAVKSMEVALNATKVCNEQLAKSNEEKKYVQVILGKIIKGEKVGQVKVAEIDEATWAAMDYNWKNEVKLGMTGWIHENWGKLCTCQCNCGKLVSFDILKQTHHLLCKTCGDKFLKEMEPQYST